MDDFLKQFIEKGINEKKKISEQLLVRSTNLIKDKDFIQSAIEDGSKIIACSDRIRLTIEADDEVEDLEPHKRPEYFKWVHDNCELYLKNKKLIYNDFSLNCWKNVADAEYHISVSSLNPTLTAPEIYLYHRARTWAHVMLFYMHDFLNIFLTKELIESTALRGLALAIMDDAEDAKKDSLCCEHTLFSAHPEIAAEIANSLLAQMEFYQEKVPHIFQFFEKSLFGQSVLNVLVCAAALKVDQFSKNEEGESLFCVRRFLKSLA